MKIMDWLLQGDAVINRLTLKHLFDKNLDDAQEGLINRYLVLYDSPKRLFGGGLYSPKWISTHYTLLE
ncbi:MAG: hypothetical protein AB7T03_04685 [Bacilli bacterium]